jgi:signal transduction histidine kinase/DNA-binding response OmpR family regulator/ligand-binding sensor domain-containing protein
VQKPQIWIRNFSLYLFFLCNLTLINAQSNISIEHYTLDYELYYRWVYDITQDDLGFLWFANHTGLRRYDGTEFITYDHSDLDTNSLSNNTIIRVTKDHEGNIWAFGNDKVFNKLDLVSGKFTRVNSFLKNDIITTGFESMMKDFGALTNGDFIVLLQHKTVNSQDGNCSLWKYMPNANVFEHIMDVPSIDVSIEYFTERSDGKIWLWNPGFEYYLVDLSNRTFEYYPVNNDRLISSLNLDLLVDKSNNFWYPVDQNSDSIETLKSFKIPDEINVSRIDRISVDNLGNIWFYHNDDDLYHFDTKTETLEKFIDPIFRKSRGIQRMFHIYVDKEGAYWNGHIWGAVRFTKQQKLFKKYLNQPEPNDLSVSNQFSSREILEISPDKLLVKEDNNDIFILDLIELKSKKLEQRYTSISGDKVNKDFYSMEFSHDGFLWTNQVDKLVKTNLETGQIETFNIPNSLFTPVVLEDVHNTFWPRIFEDNSKNLWLCDPRGLSILDRSSNNMEAVQVEHTPASVNAYFKFASFDSAEDAIYGTYDRGIYIINCKDKSVSLMEIFGENEIYDLLITAVLKWNNEFWLSTNKGIIRYDPKIKNRKRYTRNDGLPSTLVYSVIGTKKDLWVSTQNGLSQFNPYTMQSSTFYEEQGLIDNEFNTFSYRKATNGNLYFGGPNGIIGFNPDDFEIADKILGQLNLTEFIKSDIRGENSKTIRNPTISDTKGLTIGASERNISFKYVLNVFADVEKNQYLHFMEGLETGWINDENTNEVRYAQIPPGDYTFRVKATGPLNIPALNEIAIPIKVKQYWYKRWWAIASYFLLILSAVILFYRFQLNHKLEKQEAIRIKELDQLKTKMYTNITHDFRTPLTVMLGMNDAVKDYAFEGNMEKLDNANEMIDRNGKNLLGLINQMLELSKLESGKLDIHNQQEDIISYLKYRLEPFQSYAKEKEIQFTFSSDEDQIVMDFDREKISHIVRNIVSNAIKFTPEKGKINVNVRKHFSEKQNPFLELQVKDDGIGIESDKIENIFDRFYMVEDTVTKKGEGSGIGLSLVKELIKLLTGSIDVKSEINQGTEFIIHLPISNIAPFAKASNLSSSNQEFNYSPLFAQEESDAFFNDSKEAPLVLIVEDNADVLHYIGISLKDHYRTVIARNGSEGIEKAIELIPDIIISDVMMPVKDGFELCEAVKKDERTNHIPVVLLTARSDDDSKIEGLEHGADVYLAKPFNRKELLIRLKNLLVLRAELQKKYAGINFTKAIQTQSEKVDPLLLKVRTVILDNIEDEKFNVVQLCKSLFLSRAQLHRKLIAITGQSTSILIRSIRLEKAQELLEKGDLNISEVAYKVGFKTQAHFSRVFADAYGVPPSEYRNK